MRVLRVTSDLYPHVMGGVGVHTHEMSKSQSRKGHEVTVLNSKPDSEKFDEVPYKRIGFSTTIEILGNKISLDLFFKINNLMERHDVIHAHSHLFFSTNVAALLKRLKGKPLVITSHGLYSQTASTMVQSMYMPTIGRWTLSSADRVICYTQVEKEQMIGLGVPEKKITVINNGVDTNTFKPTIKKGNKKTILWVGRYVHGKGVEILIDGFSIFSKSHPDYRLLMIGKGPLKGEIEETVSSTCLEEKVEFIESVANEVMSEVYADSEVFILTSYEEGVPRSILEAMSCGIPIVSTSLPQLRDIVKDSGILVPPGNAVAVSEALCTLADDEELRERLGKNGRIRAESDFSWESTVDLTLEVYRQILDEDDD